jgi:capsule polysaccharide export protein KpsE/RkpR
MIDKLIEKYQKMLDLKQSSLKYYKNLLNNTPSNFDYKKDKEIEMWNSLISKIVSEIALINTILNDLKILRGDNNDK